MSAIENDSGTHYLTLRAVRSPMLPPDMPVTIKTSGDLLNWTTGTILTNTTSELKVRDTVPANNSPGRFIRIEATRQTPNP